MAYAVVLDSIYQRLSDRMLTDEFGQALWAVFQIKWRIFFEQDSGPFSLFATARVV